MEKKKSIITKLSDTAIVSIASIHPEVIKTAETTNISNIKNIKKSAQVFKEGKGTLPFDASNVEIIQLVDKEESSWVRSNLNITTINASIHNLPGFPKTGNDAEEKGFIAVNLHELGEKLWSTLTLKPNVIGLKIGDLRFAASSLIFENDSFNFQNKFDGHTTFAFLADKLSENENSREFFDAYKKAILTTFTTSFLDQISKSDIAIQINHKINIANNPQRLGALLGWLILTYVFGLITTDVSFDA